MSQKMFLRWESNHFHASWILELELRFLVLLLYSPEWMFVVWCVTLKIRVKILKWRSTSEKAHWGLQWLRAELKRAEWWTSKIDVQIKMLGLMASKARCVLPVCDIKAIVFYLCFAFRNTLTWDWNGYCIESCKAQPINIEYHRFSRAYSLTAMMDWTRTVFASFHPYCVVRAGSAWKGTGIFGIA